MDWKNFEKDFFSTIILITETCKIKKILQSPGVIVYFQYLGKRKNELKRSEIQVKMIIVIMKKHAKIGK